MAKNSEITGQVSGRVQCDLSAAIGGLRVSIVDKNVDGDVPLVDVQTQDDGMYAATFDLASLSKRHKDLPDLQARVFAGDTFLAASEVRYNASPSETLNVVLADSALPSLRSEYETLTAALTPYYQGKLGDLKETGAQRQITYLANKTGWDARAVALTALADQFSAGSATGSPPVAAIRPEFYYALFRAGLPANASVLYRAPADTVGTIWKQAITQGVIPAALVKEMPAALGAFQKLGPQSVLDAVPGTALASTRALLRLRLGDDTARQEQFAALAMQYQGDLPGFWAAVRKALGDSITASLQLDGQVAVLTQNNAQLMTNLYAAEKAAPPTSMLDLVRLGYYQAAKWDALLNGVTIPPVPGASPAEQRASYAELLAAQLRISYPTAVLAEMVGGGAIPLTSDATLRAGVHQFLVDNQGQYELGQQSLDQYIAANNLTGKVDPGVVTQIKRLQRVYQVTPSDQAMNVLLQHNVDSAYLIASYNRAAFINAFQGAMGGADAAALTFDNAQRVNSTVGAIATDYVMRQRTPKLGNGTAWQVGPFSSGNGSKPPASPANAPVSATLERLFGSLDYCACEECRSVIGPAAYLVDLLHFTDCASPPPKSANPQDVLFGRRPDLPYLPLTCANTDTALPYIDLVNEILEYFAANGALTNFKGYTTDETLTSEELLAIPQNPDPTTRNAAYANLATQLFPPPLPFHRPLELLRRLFGQFGIALSDAMVALRSSDAIERGNSTYGWCDILMEQLGLSRAEYQILTDSSLGLAQLCDYPTGQPDATTIDALASVETLLERTGVSYDELLALRTTRFINPNAYLIPLLEKLNVGMDVVATLKNGTLSAHDFTTIYLAQDVAAPDLAAYGGNIVAWLTDPTRYAQIMGLVTIVNPTNAADLCSLSGLQFRHADGSKLQAIDFIRLLRLIRLQRKLGLSFEQTDAILTALAPPVATITVAGNPAAGPGNLSGTIAGRPWSSTFTATESLPDLATGIAGSISLAGSGAYTRGLIVYAFATAPAATAPPALTASGGGNVTLTVGSDPLQTLDGSLLAALPRLGFAYRAIKLLDLDVGADLPSLLACWAPIEYGTTNSLYAAMFLTPAQQAGDASFMPDANGNVLDGTAALMDHEPALRSAFNLTHAEFASICGSQALNYDASTKLTLDNISAIYRRGWLARKLEISVAELLSLVNFSTIDPFGSLDPSPRSPTEPCLIRFVDLVLAIQAAGLDVAQVLYLIWNQDLRGNLALPDDKLAALALKLRADLMAVDAQFTLGDDPTGALAQPLLTLVYGSETASFFLGLLNGTFSVSIAYSGPDPSAAVIAASVGSLVYDQIAHTLTYFYDPAAMAAMQTAAAGAASLLGALTQLQAASQGTVDPLFAQHPELKQAYADFTASSDPPQTTRQRVLAGLVLALQKQRRQQQALVSVAAEAGVDASFVTALLTDAATMQATSSSTDPAVTDLTAIGTPGLTVTFSTPSGVTRQDPMLSYSPTATVAGTPQKGDTFTTTIAGVAVAYAVPPSGASAADVATSIAAAINATSATVSGVPFNALVRAASSAGTIVFEGVNIGPPVVPTCTVAPTAGSDATYAAGTELLAGSGPFAATWSGCLDVPQDGDYLLTIAADTATSPALAIAGATLTLTPQSPCLWTARATALQAGTFVPFTLSVTGLKTTLYVGWQTQGIDAKLIPSERLYAQSAIDALHSTYVRFLKATALATALSLDAGELAFLARAVDLQVPGASAVLVRLRSRRSDRRRGSTLAFCATRCEATRRSPEAPKRAALVAGRRQVPDRVAGPASECDGHGRAARPHGLDKRVADGAARAVHAILRRRHGQLFRADRQFRPARSRLCAGDDMRHRGRQAHCGGDERSRRGGGGGAPIRHRLALRDVRLAERDQADQRRHARAAKRCTRRLCAAEDGRLRGGGHRHAGDHAGHVVRVSARRCRNAAVHADVARAVRHPVRAAVHRALPAQPRDER